jgi:hypothetical protein
VGPMAQKDTHAGRSSSTTVVPSVDEGSMAVCVAVLSLSLLLFRRRRRYWQTLAQLVSRPTATQLRREPAPSLRPSLIRLCVLRT